MLPDEDEKEIDDAGQVSEADQDEGQNQPDADEDDGEAAAGDAGEEGGSEEVVDDEPEEVTERRTRGQSRFQVLSERAKTAAEEAATARREAAELKARLERLERPVVQQETEEQEQARLVLMTPEERSDYKLEKANRQHRAQIQQVMFQTQEIADKATFSGILTGNPALKKYEPEVDKLLSEMRSKGQNAPREALLDLAIGREARMKGLGSVEKQKQEGQKKIAAQQAKPTNSKGDAQPRRGKLNERDAREKRLEKFTF